MKTTGRVRAGGAAILVALAAHAHAAGPAKTAIPLTVSGNEAKGSFELPGGIDGELTLTFEQVSGLTPDSLEASAALVSPDDQLLWRFHESGSLRPPDDFPVVIEVAPSEGSTLSFSGVVTVTLYTHVLHLDRDEPLSLVWAHGGAPFTDRSAFETSGSYRAGATAPSLSAFEIVRDPRAIDNVISGKFGLLGSRLSQHKRAIPREVRRELKDRLEEAEDLFDSDEVDGAVDALTRFQEVVKEHSGAEIPDVWRADDSLVNVAGLLRSDAETLKFSLKRKSGP
jgi:hypothetical protein